jgi:hypothetical protein
VASRADVRTDTRRRDLPSSGPGDGLRKTSTGADPPTAGACCVIEIRDGASDGLFGAIDGARGVIEIARGVAGVKDSGVGRESDSAEDGAGAELRDDAGSGAGDELSAAATGDEDTGPGEGVSWSGGTGANGSGVSIETASAAASQIGCGVATASASNGGTDPGAGRGRADGSGGGFDARTAGGIERAAGRVCEGCSARGGATEACSRSAAREARQARRVPCVGGRLRRAPDPPDRLRAIALVPEHAGDLEGLADLLGIVRQRNRNAHCRIAHRSLPSTSRGYLPRAPLTRLFRARRAAAGGGQSSDHPDAPLTSAISGS